jgi:hypothetical protein
MNKLCTVTNCDNKVFAAGLCCAHYQRLRKKGTFELDRKTDEERFMSYVSIDETTGAWLWTGGLTSYGYGQFWAKGKTVLAHRFSYAMRYGEIPKRILVCHKYENLGNHNVNPEHLFLGTNTDNMRDAATKDRIAYGENNGSSVLSEGDISEIRTSPLKGYELAEKYNVSSTTISHIKRGHHWVREKNNPENINSLLNLNNKTGYRGVRLRKGRYIAGLTSKILKKSFHLGTFDNPIDAAKAYDKKAKECFGDKAKLNFS